ncbi:hypothetical protein HYH02_015381 [Chlamydomonas schloesseri]|uniref:DUF7781 domain-containing protein n=1 Tax=Chlamydomonas schloesseri TaxID=2026947 RepID=A0A835SM49_9CHLO|nr:hypothetical protein HYH02_015381 [Chlamydomonas schloesseri]|eukprot:KAG2422945.1 hypothetical protein HYH02_015381 [Chlamydomonas schloesseri]
MSLVDDDDAHSQGVNSVIDEILDQYRFNWEPEYRIKFKKELASFTLGVGLSKPHQAQSRLRLTLKPEHSDAGWRPGRFVQKVLVLPQQHFAALYSRKLAWGILRCQFVAGYFWDRQRPSLDYRLSTKWNEGLRIKRKEYYQPHNNLLLRAKWNLDMQLPDVEGHLGGMEGSTQVPVDVEYGSLDFSVTQLDCVVDLDGHKYRSKKGTAAAGASAAVASPAPGSSGSSSNNGGGGAAGRRGGNGDKDAGAAATGAGATGLNVAGAGSALAGRIAWPWQTK